MQYIITLICIVCSLFFVPVLALGKSPPTERLIKEKTKGENIYYSGTITVSGHARRDVRDTQGYSEYVEMGGRFCVYLSKHSQKLIPKERAYERSEWFCFSNPKTAIKLFNVPASIPKGTCGYEFSTEIVVTNYVLSLNEEMAIDTAHLVRVISRGELAPISCLPRKLEIDGDWY